MWTPQFPSAPIRDLNLAAWNLLYCPNLWVCHMKVRHLLLHLNLQAPCPSLNHLLRHQSIKPTSRESILCHHLEEKQLYVFICKAQQSTNPLPPGLPAMCSSPVIIDQWVKMSTEIDSCWLLSMFRLHLQAKQIITKNKTSIVVFHPTLCCLMATLAIHDHPCDECTIRNNLRSEVVGLRLRCIVREIITT